MAIGEVMIKALIFDLNDTLDESTNVKLKAMRDALKSAGVRIEASLVGRIMVDIERIDLRNPQLGMDEIVYLALERLETNPKAKRRICKEYALQREKGKDISDEFIEMLPLLADKYRLMIFTGGPRKGADRWLDRHGIKKYFSEVYITGELGLHKPSVEALERILKDQSLKASECIMIGDDVIKDLLPAKTLGIKTILLSEIVDEHAKDFIELKHILV